MSTAKRGNTEMSTPTCPFKIQTSNIRRGENHHHTHLTEEMVLNIREECSMAVEMRKELKKYSMKAIGERYGISAQTVYELNKGITWSHVA